MHVAGKVEPDPSSGTVVATFHGLPPGSFQAQGKATCASEVLPVSGPLHGDQFTSNVDLDQIGGHCSLTLTLHSTLSPDPYGVPSPAFTSLFSIGAVSSYRFSVAVSEPCGRYCATFDLLVTYNGSGEPPGTDWQVTAAGGPICDAGTPVEAAAAFPVTVKWPTTCPTPTVTVSWVYLGQAGTGVVGVANLPSLACSASPHHRSSAFDNRCPCADYHHLRGAPVHDGCHGRPGNDRKPAVQYNHSKNSNHSNNNSNNNRPRHHHPRSDNHHQLRPERLPDQHTAGRHNPAADHHNPAADHHNFAADHHNFAVRHHASGHDPAVDHDDFAVRHHASGHDPAVDHDNFAVRHHAAADDRSGPPGRRPTRADRALAPSGPHHRALTPAPRSKCGDVGYGDVGVDRCAAGRSFSPARSLGVRARHLWPVGRAYRLSKRNYPLLEATT